jgi:hypothetical protein
MEGGRTAGRNEHDLLKLLHHLRRCVGPLPQPILTQINAVPWGVWNFDSGYSKIGCAP